MTMATDNDKDKTVHQQADQHKRNLNEGKDVRVSDGRDGGRGPRPDPFSARKAMFAKADELRDAQAAQGGSIQDARLEALARESGHDLDALRQGHTGAPTATTAPVEPSTSRTLHLNKDKTGEPASTSPSQTADTYVTVTLNGAEIKVAQRDIDRAGGVEQYVARREQNARDDAMARENAELKRQIEEMRRRQQELQQGSPSPAAQGTEPANRAATPAAQDRNDPGTTGVEDDKLAERLADQIYSGDRDDALKGVRDLIRLARGKGETPDMAAIVRQVRAELAGTPGAEGTKQPTTPQPARDPMVDRVNREINAMALAEFPELMANRAAAAATYERFLELVKAPENANRLALDVARDALEEMEPKFVNPRAGVIDRKRGLQPASAASGAQQDAGPAPVSPSSYIEQLAESRRFGSRRPQP